MATLNESCGCQLLQPLMNCSCRLNARTSFSVATANVFSSKHRIVDRRRKKKKTQLTWYSVSTLNELNPRKAPCYNNS